MKETAPRRMQLAGLFLFAFSLPVSFVPAQLGIACSFLGWLADGILNRRWTVRLHPVLFPILLYLAWNVVSALFSIQPVHSLAAVVDNEWAMLVMVMMLWLIPDARTLGRLVAVFFSTSVIASLYAVWQTFSGTELWRALALDPIGNYYRAVGFVGFYLTFAGFAMTVFFLAANIALETKGRWRVWSTAVAAVSFLAVIATFARSIWLSFGVAIPLTGFLRDKKRGIIMTAALVLIAVAAFITVPSLRDRMTSIIDPAQNVTRLNLWKSALGMIAARPVLGIGQDNFMTVFPDFRVEGSYDTIVHPHNDYLNVAVNSGLPGLAGFLAIWFVALRSGVQSWRRSSDPLLRGILMGGVTGIVGFLVGSLFQNYYGTFANCLGWWFITGLMMTAVRLQTDAATQSKS